jgi:acetylornithine deacetylase/succinyl-diaminopimelate desuccinylase-like protein
LRTDQPDRAWRAARRRWARGLAAASAATLLLAAAPARPAPDADDSRQREAVAAWVAGHRADIVAELTEFLTLPNVSADVADVRDCAAHLQGMLRRRGLETRLLEADGSGTAPYVFARLPAGEKPAGGRPPVVLFYAHFDGQPTLADRWTVTRPFTPLLRGDVADPDARLYARSSSDDKGSIVALLAAIDALRGAGIPSGVEAKFIFDSEEELNSPHLEAVLARHADLLKSDLFIFADGPVHQSGRPTLAFGTRGNITVTLTAYGPAHEIHSGHYGNWAPNPAEKLAALLASMKDADGRVLVEGFYDDVRPLSESEKGAIAAAPPIENELESSLLIARPDGGGRGIQELINLPSLNIRGLSSGSVGPEARTIIPSSATAEIDLRLVRDIDPLRQVERLMAHARSRGYTVVETEPDGATRRARPNIVRITHGPPTAASRTPMDTPLSRAVIAAVRRASRQEAVLMPTLGGTGPLSRFETALGVPVYAVPIVNFDNNQHAPDENLRLGNLWDGIVTYASLLRLPPPAAGPAR